MTDTTDTTKKGMTLADVYDHAIANAVQAAPKRPIVDPPRPPKRTIGHGTPIGPGHRKGGLGRYLKG